MTSNISNLMAIWYYDEHISTDTKRQMKIRLHQTFNYSLIFNVENEFIGYITAPIIVKRIILIITSKDATHIAKRIHFITRKYQQPLLIYQLPFENQKSSTFPDPATERHKIKKNFDTIIRDLYEVKLSFDSAEDKICRDELNTDESALPFGIFKSVSAQNSFCCLNKESLKFYLFQSLIEVLLNMVYNSKALKHMWNLCRKDYRQNCIEMKKIDTFEQNYTQDKAINYYTRDSFLFRLINRAFRLDDIDRIFRFGCYIADLHKQLEKLNHKQRSDSSQTPSKVYRGKKLSTDVLQQLKDNIGQLISMNGLLSTTKDFDTSTMYAGIEGPENDYHSAVFEMRIHSTTSVLPRPYANVSKVSSIQDDNEVLFFMGFVWKIISMESLPKRWHIILESCKDYDPEFITYIEHVRCDSTFFTLGNILRELGDHANAKNFYRRSLNDENLLEKTRVHVLYNMALLAEDMGEYMDALQHLQQAKELIEPIATLNHGVPAPSKPLFAHNIAPSRLNILNNMGRLYLKDGEEETARSCFLEALEEPGSEVEKATVLYNYGLLEYESGNYNQAHDYYARAVQKAKDDACVNEFKYNLELTQNMLHKKRTEAMDIKDT